MLQFHTIPHTPISQSKNIHTYPKNKKKKHTYKEKGTAHRNTETAKGLGSRRDVWTRSCPTLYPNYSSKRKKGHKRKERKKNRHEQVTEKRSNTLYSAFSFTKQAQKNNTQREPPKQNQFRHKNKSKHKNQNKHN
jgi:hypothetical protein